MTEARNLKHAIRARAEKTGESYTAARVHVLKALRKRGRKPTAPPPPPSPRPAAGLSDAAVIAKTGCPLAHWFEVLDTFRAGEKGHTAAARHLHYEHGIPAGTRRE